MKNYLVPILFFLFMAGRICAQQFSPTVISTSGGFYTNTSGMLSFTTGEMAAVETYLTPSVILTQGFQQNQDLGTFIIEDPKLHLTFDIFPNPSDGTFNLITKTEKSINVELKIVDVLGREIERKKFACPDKINIQPFDLSNALSGIYMIILETGEHDGGPVNHYISKIQIVK